MGCLDFCVVSADHFIPAYQRWETHPARQDWEPIKDLGSGSFSQVVLARHIITGALAALKVVFLDNPELDPETEAMLAQEGDLLLHLSHPSLVSCSQVIKSPSAHVLVLEFLRGCCVLDGLCRISEAYTERDAWSVFHQLASAVAYLHSRSVIHRDLKPENLVYTEKFAKPLAGITMEEREKQEPPIVKVVDLGMAWRYDPNISERGVLGSAGFVAPEIIKGGIHTPAMDVFSMGVLLFIMLVGRKPFNIEDSEKLRYAKMGLAAAPGLRDPRWLDLSPDAKHLLMGMLTFDPERRLTAAQVLEHEWVTTKGGRVLRMLGMDVALGAATVAEMRRLKFLCNGVVAMRRVAFSVEEQNQSRKNKKNKQKQQMSSQNSAPAGGVAAKAVEVGSCREHAYYLDNLRRMQRRESSVRNGGNRSFRGIARTITAASYRHIHDTGGSVHCGEEAVPKASTGMRRSGTALLLSEVLSPAPEFGSIHGGSVRSSGGGGSYHNSGNSAAASGMSRSTSGLFLLGASLRQYMDVSIHGASSGNSAAKLLSNATVAPEGDKQPPPPPPAAVTLLAPKDVGKTTSVPASIPLASPPTIRTIVVKKRGSFDTPLTPTSLHYGNNNNNTVNVRSGTSTSTDEEYLKIIQARATANDSGLGKELYGGSRNSLDTSSSPTKSNRSGSAGRRVHSVKPLSE
ncbi:hypothetical protein Ndes2526B_g08437 [Nannochloris sp. 'desiccata']|nr:putative Calcium/calmodulin-dependent protein kinase type II [Chlorella desiccata (nom. nud.)]